MDGPFKNVIMIMWLGSLPNTRHRNWLPHFSYGLYSTENIMKFKKLPSVDYLKECFSFNSDTGELTWKRRPLHHYKSTTSQDLFNRRFPGKTLVPEVSGYIFARIDGLLYPAHRLIYKIYTGVDPENKVIDHINGIKHDNRLCNLRLATKSQNGMNRIKLDITNNSGYRGVYLCKHTGRYIAKVHSEGVSYWGGRHDTAELASKAAINVRNTLHSGWNTALKND